MTDQTTPPSRPGAAVAAALVGDAVPPAPMAATAPSPITEEAVMRAVEAIPARLVPYMTTRQLDRRLGGFDVRRGTWTNAVEARLRAYPGTIFRHAGQISVKAELFVRYTGKADQFVGAMHTVFVVFTPTGNVLGHPVLQPFDGPLDGSAENDVTGDVDAFAAHLGKLGVLDLAPIRDALGQDLLDLGDWDVVDHAVLVADASTMRVDGPAPTIRARLRIVVVDGADNQEIIEEDVIVTVVDPADWGAEISIEIMPPTA